MNPFNRLKGSRTEPPGLERRILRALPAMLALGTLLPAMYVLGLHLLALGGAEELLRRAEMALGEVLGTNFVNLSLILLADVMFSGGAVINELGRFEAISALLGVLLTGSYLIGLLERRNPVLLRMGYDSVAVLLLFAGGVALLFVIR